MTDDRKADAAYHGSEQPQGEDWCWTTYEGQHMPHSWATGSLLWVCDDCGMIVDAPSQPPID